MSQVKQILLMRDKGKGIKTIAKSLCISKNTVKEYLRKVEAGNVPVKELLRLEDPILEKTFYQGILRIKKMRFTGSSKTD